MKRRLLGLTGACIVASTTALAASPQDNSSDMDQQLHKLMVQTEALESRVKALNAQVAELKRNKKQQALAQANLQTQVESNKRHIARAEQQKSAVPVKAQNPEYALVPTVTASPYLGLRSAFDGSDLFTNLPNMNEDLKILQQRQDIKKQHLEELGQAPVYENRPVIELGGQLAAQGAYNNPYSGSSSSDIDLTTAQLDTLVLISDWATALMSVVYDNSLSQYAAVPGNRISNSHLYLNRGFLTIGDLDKSPFYFSVGQMFVPFGNYASFMVTDPMTKILARTNQRAAVFGFEKDGLYSQVYAFKGPSNVSAPGINQGGINAGYDFNSGKWNANLGAGYILNMADSAGMQSNGASGDAFQGFGVDTDYASSSDNEHLVHRVPAVNLHGVASYGPYTLIGEYVGATRSFDATNLSFNNSGARPQAVQAEAVYSFTFADKPSNFGLAYNKSWQALALNLPQQSMFATLNTSIWKDTVESLEFRHDINYSSSDTASGNGAPIPVNALGSSQNTITAQLAVYF